MENKHARDEYFRINFFLLRFHSRWRDSYAIINRARRLSSSSRKMVHRDSRRSERETRAVGLPGVSLLTDKKVTKVADESFGFTFGERGK